MLRFHHLCAGKSKEEIRVGNEQRNMRHRYMGLWYFLYKEKFHYFREGALEVWHYTLIDLVEAAKAMERSVGIPWLECRNVVGARASTYVRAIMRLGISKPPVNM